MGDSHTTNNKIGTDKKSQQQFDFVHFLQFYVQQCDGIYNTTTDISSSYPTNEIQSYVPMANGNWAQVSIIV